MITEPGASHELDSSGPSCYYFAICYYFPMLKKGATSVIIAFVVAASGTAAADSLDELRRRAKKPPTNPQKALELGRELRHGALYQESLRALRMGYGKARGIPMVSALRMAVARTHLANHDQKRALRECEQLKKLKSRTQYLCIAEARLMRKRGSLALPAAEKMLKYEPKNYDAMVAKGRAQAQLGRTKDAEFALRQAIALEPNRHEAFEHLGHLQLAAGRTSEGTDSLRSALKLGPQSALVQFALAGALPVGTEAVTLLQSAIAQRRQYAEAHARLGKVLLKLERWKEAETALVSASGLKPSKVDWSVDLAKAVLAQGRARPALAAVQAALKVAPHHPEAKLVEADALAASGEIDLAISAYEMAYGLSRREPASLVRGAQASLRGKRPTTAAAFAERAVDEFPKWAPAGVVAGDVAAAHGTKADAKRAYKKALKLGGPLDRAAVKKKLRALQ